MDYKIIDIEQNTLEWLEMRQKHIGASDAPIIMGDSPWSTEFELWENKLGLNQKDHSNFATDRGQRLEPIARNKFIEIIGISVNPKVVLSEVFPWALASLDGLSECGSVAVEIKCPGSTDHNLAISGVVPSKYRAQLQHQLAVLNLDMIYYFSFSSENFAIIEVNRDEEYISKLLKKEKSFMEKVKNWEAPELTSRDYVQNESPELVTSVERWKEIQEKKKEILDEEVLCKEMILKLCHNKSTICNDVKIKKVIRKGSIDYSKIDVLNNIDLEMYRKKSSAYWTIK